MRLDPEKDPQISRSFEEELDELIVNFEQSHQEEGSEGDSSLSSFKVDVVPEKGPPHRSRVAKHFTMGRGGIYLYRSHPRASEIRRKLKRINAELDSLLVTPPVKGALKLEIPTAGQVPATPIPEKREWELSTQERLDRYYGVRGEEGESPASDEVHVVWENPDSKPTRKRRRRKASSPPAEGSEPSARSSKTPGMEVPSGTQESLPTQKSVPRTDTFTAFTRWQGLKARFKGTGLFITPRTCKEKRLKALFVELIARYGRDSRLPQPHVHPRDNPGADGRRRRRERRRVRDKIGWITPGNLAVGIRWARRYPKPGWKPGPQNNS
jgi:hypothetical protein